MRPKVPAKPAKAPVAKAKPKVAQSPMPQPTWPSPAEIAQHEASAAATLRALEAAKKAALEAEALRVQAAHILLRSPTLTNTAFSQGVPASPPPMDPQLKSALTTMGAVAAAGAATWAVGHGFIAAGDQAAISNALIALAGAALTVGIGVWKTRAHTPTAIAAQVNSASPAIVSAVVDAVNSNAVPGVKVVAATPQNAAAPQVVVDAKTGRVKVDNSIPPMAASTSPHP
jgi:hypothetical protein